MHVWLKYVKINIMETSKDRIIRRICNALNVNAIENAKEIIETDLKKYGSKDEYYFYSALVSEDLETKLELYTKAIKYNPEFLDAYINRGLVKNELQDYEGSIKDYDRAIELDSKCALAYNNRGYTKFKQGDFQGALKDYNKAILLNPKFKMAIDNKAQLLMQVCLEDDKDFSEKYYLSMGISDINAGKLPDAIKNLDEALKYNPNSDIAYFYKGVCEHNLGGNDEAYRCYSKAIELNKNMIDAYFNRGQIMFKDDPKSALDDFVKAVALDPKFIDAYYSIAAIQKSLGQYENAIKNLDKILELEPNAVNAKALKKLIQTKYLGM